MITSLRQQQRAAQQPKPAAPPPALVPYAEHQQALRDLGRKLVAERTHTLDIRSVPEVQELAADFRKVSEQLQAREGDFEALWNRAAELEQQVAERDAQLQAASARIAELEQQVAAESGKAKPKKG